MAVVVALESLLGLQGKVRHHGPVSPALLAYDPPPPRVTGGPQALRGGGASAATKTGSKRNLQDFLNGITHGCMPTVADDCCHRPAAAAMRIACAWPLLPSYARRSIHYQHTIILDKFQPLKSSPKAAG